MKKGICCAGNIIVDISYPIEKYPRAGELTHIFEGIGRSTGGSVCNTITDLARLAPKMHLTASGIVGKDSEGDFVMEELGRYSNIDCSPIRREGRTSFTAVMNDLESHERTFFQFAGANAVYGEAHIDWDRIDADIFHIGYILLLPHLDEPDAEYGTKMARLLCEAKQHGFRTSIDVVTEAGDRFARLVPPALRYTDYCVINELEAQQTTGVCLRDGGGTLRRENLPAALRRLRELGVSRWAVIHCPELGCGMAEDGAYVEFPSLRLPAGYIKGTVGAGDAFCAGALLSAYNGSDLSRAIDAGCAAAACSLRRPGASEGVGTLEEARKLAKELGLREE